MAMDVEIKDAIDRNKRLLGLALDCRLIYPRKKEKIETILKEKLKTDDTTDVLDILKEEKVLTEEKAAYLLELDAHTAACARDRMFGRLAVVNTLASETDIESALAAQKKRFQKDGESIRLGEILVDRGIMTEADCIAILMTQNRVKHQDLLSAMDRLGRTPGETDIINKRFGIIAIKKGLVTTEQVGQALGCQKSEAGQGKKPRFIGTILQEISGLSEDDTAVILREQKQMEVRRLDLQQALYPVKSELRIFKRLNSIFSYTISADGIEAFVRKLMEPNAPVPVYEFIIWLRKAGIRFGILNDDVLTEVIDHAGIGQPVLVARGQAPEPGRNQGVRFYFEDQGRAFSSGSQKTEPIPDGEDEKPSTPGNQDIPGEGHKLPRENTPPAPGPVTHGDLLAQMIPGQEGKPGKNIMGHPVYPARPLAMTLYAGKGVIRKGNDFLAAAEGFPRLKNGTTLVVDSLAPSVEIRTLTMDIREDTGEKYLQTDLSVKGNILAGAAVKCRSLLLEGDLLGEAGCGGDMTIEGCLGQDSPLAQDREVPGLAAVICHGAVKVSQSVSNANVLCAGTFTALNARAAGVRICAGRGLTVKEAVAGGTGPSILRTGLLPQDPLLSIDQTLEARQTELAALKKEAETAQLTEAFESDLKKAEQHLLEQDIYWTLAQIIEAPELFQYPALSDKLDYLYRLPDHSSIKAFYLKLPDTRAASAVVNRFLPPGNRSVLEDVLQQLRGKLDPAPEDRDTGSLLPEPERLKIEFNARLEALTQDVQENQEAIERMQKEMTSLSAAREKLGRAYVTSMSPVDFPVVRVKNKCEKGTVIQGILASLTLDETVYNVRFREVVDPKTLTASIVLEG